MNRLRPTLNAIFVIAFICDAVFSEFLVTTDACGKTKVCNYFQDGRMVSWSMSAAPDSIDIELLSAPVRSADPYIAFGFGTTNQMVDVDVYFCTNDEIGSGVIKVYHDPLDQLPLENGIDQLGLSLIDGRLHCKFTRPLSVTKTIGGSIDHDFDLKMNKYYILLAQGIHEKGVIDYHTWRQVTTDQTDFLGSIAALQPTVTSVVAEPTAVNASSPTVEPTSTETVPQPEQHRNVINVSSIKIPAVTSNAPLTTTSDSKSTFAVNWIVVSLMAFALLIF